MSKKHYTEVEKNLLVEILKRYGSIIESKKSDCGTLKEKEEAWREIGDAYNASSVIITKRTIKQLKKVWSNLKTTQRNLLTLERQNILRTGGGPPVPSVEINPEIIHITPNLMENAPVIFGSDASEEQIREDQQRIYDLVAESREFECEGETTDANDVELGLPLNEIININNNDNCNDNNDNNSSSIEAHSKNNDLPPNINFQHSRRDTRKRKAENFNNKIAELKLKKIQLSIADQVKMAKLKINHEQKKQEMEIQFLKKKYEIELENINKS